VYEAREIAAFVSILITSFQTRRTAAAFLAQATGAATEPPSFVF
jgi:hypothetical protein